MEFCNRGVLGQAERKGVLTGARTDNKNVHDPNHTGGTAYKPTILENMSSVFTKIIAGDLPGRFVYRDEDVVAFLTIEPLAYGHVLVVPVAEVDKWTDVDPTTWAKLNELAQRVGKAIIEVFAVPRAGYVIAGFDVPHTHIHVFPAAKMSDYDFSQAMSMDATDPAQMDAAAEKLRQALGTDEKGLVK
ncbi:hypothetical protein KPHES18084_17760 [Corynebacterium ulcerans]|nr:hypothetical protein CULTSU28_18860 [Corynebacterium ulcerans]STC82433.1 phosphoribosylamine--glycine ligase [Corynebacterium ulcerans]